MKAREGEKKTLHADKHLDRTNKSDKKNVTNTSKEKKSDILIFMNMNIKSHNPLLSNINFEFLYMHLFDKLKESHLLYLI
jgi:hypothetical protein